MADRRDDAFYVVISLDRPYDVHAGTSTVTDVDTIEIPFATLASAERAEGGIMTHVRAARQVLQGDVVSDDRALEA